MSTLNREAESMVIEIATREDLTATKWEWVADLDMDGAVAFLLMSSEATERGIRRELEVGGMVEVIDATTGRTFRADVVTA